MVITLPPPTHQNKYHQHQKFWTSPFVHTSFKYNYFFNIGIETTHNLAECVRAYVDVGTRVLAVHPGTGGHHLQSHVAC